jgi:hypothetical protein
VELSAGTENFPFLLITWILEMEKGPENVVALPGVIATLITPDTQEEEIGGSLS